MSFNKQIFNEKSFDKQMFDKQLFIKELEEDETNYNQEEPEETPDREFNFSPESIKDVINNLLEELNPRFVSVFDISIFLGNVGKNLTQTVKSKNLTINEKYTIILNISKTVIDELEERGLIDLELANEFRETFKSSAGYSDLINDISNFMSSSKEHQKEMINNFTKKICDNIVDGLATKFLDFLESDK
jgi:hypothetical protein